MAMVVEGRISLALALFEAGAFLDKTKSQDGRGFKLKLHEKHPNAPRSPFYLNLRTPANPKPGPLTPDLVDACGHQLFKLAENRHLRFDAVAGLPNAGDPLAEAFVQAARYEGRRVPLVRLAKETTDDKREISKIIESPCRPGSLVLIVDDLITGADTKLEGIRLLESAGFVVRDLVVLVDRDQGGSRELYKRDYCLHALLLFSNLLTIYQREKLLSPEQADEIRAYLVNNGNA